MIFWEVLKSFIAKPELFIKSHIPEEIPMGKAVKDIVH